MQHQRIREPQPGFHVLMGTPRSQAATMTLAPGERIGDADNRHPGADQWLYVLEGSGRARVAGEEVALAPGSLLLIGAGESHQIENPGDQPLRTLNVYAPPEYFNP